MSVPEKQEIPLVWATYFSKCRITKEFANHVQFDSWKDDFTGDLILAVKAKVLGERVHDVEYPADWWQALRQRWFPRFWLAKFPVRKVYWSVAFLYPQIAVRADLKPVVAIYKTPHHNNVHEVK